MQLTTITLEAHHTTNRHTYFVTFAGNTPADAEAQAVTFIGRKQSTHAFHAPEDWDVMQRPAQYPTLHALLWPTCEHGLSEWNCYGPQHYARETEIAEGW